jgi:uncharacterized FlgJ-related protein
LLVAWGDLRLAVPSQQMRELQCLTTLHRVFTVPDSRVLTDDIEASGWHIFRSGYL